MFHKDTQVRGYYELILTPRLGGGALHYEDYRTTFGIFWRETSEIPALRMVNGLLYIYVVKICVT